MSLASQNPYVGLRPFKSDESLLFFGRNQQTIEILQRLHRNRFVAVIGGSGSGKSSLIRAGVVPKLKAGFLIENSDKWVIIKMKPGRDPLFNLVESMCLQFLGKKPLPHEAKDILDGIREEGVDFLIKFIQEHSKDIKSNIFLLVDQFEELFRFSLNTEKHDDALELVHLMLEFSNQQTLPVNVVMTMRSDFIGDCSEFHGLAEALNESQYLVPKMSRQELKSAIEGPAKLFGKTITPRLRSRLLNDLNSVKDELPLLQHALMRIWKVNKSDPKNNELDLDDYKTIGTIQYALSNHAQEAYEDLSEKDKKIAETMFKGLTTVDENGRKIRRPLLLSNIEELSSASREDILRITDKFIEDNRSFLILQTLSDGNDINIDISHESLIRQWDTLSNWVEEEAEAASIYIQIAKAYELKQQDKRGFLDSVEVARAKHWIEKNRLNKIWASKYGYDYNEVINYIEESRATLEKEELEKKRKTRRIQKLMAWVIGLLVLIILAGVVIGIIETNRQIKEEKENQAELLYYQALSYKDTDPTIAYRLLDEAIKIKENNVYIKALEDLKQNKSFYKNIGSIKEFGLKDFRVFQPFSVDENGEHVFIIDSLNKARLTDSTGKILMTFDEQSINASAFGKNNATLYYTEGSNTIHVYDANSTPKKTSFQVNLEDDEITTITSLNNGIFLIGTNKNKVYSVSLDGTIIQTDNFDGTESAIRTIAASPDGNHYVVIDNDRNSFVKRTAIPTQLDENYRYTSADISMDGRIVIGATNGMIQIIDNNNNQLPGFKVDESPVTYVSFIKNSQYLISGNDKGVVTLWSSEGNKVQEFIGHTEVIFGHSLSENGKYITTFSNDGTFKRWKLKQPIKERVQVERRDITQNDLKSSSKDPKIQVIENEKLWTNALSKKSIESVNLKNGYRTTLIPDLSSCNGMLKDFKVSGDKSTIMVSCSRGAVEIFNTENVERITSLDTVGALSGFGFLNKKSDIYSASFRGIINIFSNDDNRIEPLETISLGSAISISALCATPNEQLIVSLRDVGIFNINPKTKDRNPIITTDTLEIAVLKMSNDSKKLAIGSTTGDVYVWGLDSKSFITTLPNIHGDNRPVSTIEFSENNKSLLSVGEDGSAFLHNLEGKQELKLKSGSIGVLGAQFSEKNTIIVLSSDGTIISRKISEDEEYYNMLDNDIEPLSTSLRRQFNLQD